MMIVECVEIIEITRVMIDKIVGLTTIFALSLDEIYQNTNEKIIIPLRVDDDKTRAFTITTVVYHPVDMQEFFENITTENEQIKLLRRLCEEYNVWDYEYEELQPGTYRLMYSIQFIPE